MLRVVGCENVNCTGSMGPSVRATTTGPPTARIPLRILADLLGIVLPYFKPTPVDSALSSLYSLPYLSY
jgi:hypothetical protein